MAGLTPDLLSIVLVLATQAKGYSAGAPENV